MSSTPEQTFVALTQQSGQIATTEVESVYNKLNPIKAESLLGQWKGGSFDTGHPAHQALTTISWQGKTFHGLDNVDPIDVLKDEERLREVKFRDVVSTAMIYDNHPIIDHFR
ncbi:hypothetical protein FE257_011795 [Aspergillus nanangensis]|uniref:GXWXG domain-containing protein n=1 Tax=Aspergillus nanangensis TaxID=2582783 RepID=A0AAD4CVQ5_ASPNN|nr:hypothetical protein FE257_011795 [Aspergillus nanangensis]